jgi:hypothetical protein
MEIYDDEVEVEVAPPLGKVVTKVFTKFCASILLHAKKLQFIPKGDKKTKEGNGQPKQREKVAR